ncbi:conserved hypothetical protein [Ricinus communis]|uniref:Uncharacterized protein n=1 Tax=Ricinus communis TaxID=3988 RepID=B9T1Y4_RICCO|nr:conserved hypothetical protein [Ricinus communis]
MGTDGQTDRQGLRNRQLPLPCHPSSSSPPPPPPPPPHCQYLASVGFVFAWTPFCPHPPSPTVYTSPPL